ncbi:MAG: TorF family putative porin [Pseudomonadota bacterium]
MIKSRSLLAGALLAVAGAASADITVTPAIVWDYDYRGISQTGGDPAAQVGLTYTHSSGYYAGAWASNVNFGPGDPEVEMDFFTGFGGGDASKSFAYDVGILYYTYVSSSDLNWLEIYAGITKGWFNAKLSYSWDFGGTSLDAYYLEGNATIPIGESGFSALGHIGWSDGSYWDDFYGNGYFDWSVGVSKAFGHITATVKYIDGSDLPDGGSDIFKTDGKAWIGISTTLPWKSE